MILYDFDEKIGPVRGFPGFPRGGPGRPKMGSEPSRVVRRVCIFVPFSRKNTHLLDTQDPGGPGARGTNRDPPSRGDYDKL